MGRIKVIFYWALLAIFTTGLVLPQSVFAQDDPCLKPKAAGCSFGLKTDEYDKLLEEMKENPAPDAKQLPVAQDELGTRPTYRVVGGATPLYDGPNGKPAGAVNTDFKRIYVLDQKDGWAEILPKRWVPMKNITKDDASAYSGLEIDKPLAYPMAWILVPTRPSEIPGVIPDKSVEMLERYTAVNLFATKTVGKTTWYLVGPGQWLEKSILGLVLPVERPEGVTGRWIAVDLYQQVLQVFDEDNKLIFTTLISSGRPTNGTNTNPGVYHIQQRLRWSTMQGGSEAEGDYYYLPNVPYTMFFDGSISLHGTYWHDNFGYRRSHGCVNLSVTDARWLYNWVGDNFKDLSVDIYMTQKGVKMQPRVQIE